MKIETQCLLLPSSIGSFDADFLGSGVYALSPRGATKFYTGATLTKFLELPYSHRILKVELKHTDNADADSTDSWSYQIRRQGIWDLFNTLRSGTAVTVSDVLETFDDSFVSGATIYRIYCTQTTAADRIYPTFFVEIL